MTARVEVRDLGMAQLRADLLELRALKIHAGVQGAKGDAQHPGADGLTVAELAAIHEYGAPAAAIPPRPFLRHTAEVNRAKFREALRAGVADVIDRRATPLQAFSKVGELMSRAIVESIDRANEWATPNAPETIRRKGHDRVLRDSGVLRGSITFQVRRGAQTLAEG